MKHLLRSFLGYFIAVYVASLVIPGVAISGNVLRTTALVSGVLMLLHTFVRPVLELFLLPLNILTLGLLKKAADIFLVYSATFIVPEFSINSFYFPGATVFGLSLPEMEVNKLLSIVVSVLFIVVVKHVISWIGD
jgi:uncharacterized membrane protein YvlD (DUF360 family)